MTTRSTVSVFALTISPRLTMPREELSFPFSGFRFAAEPEMDVLVPNTESGIADLGDS